MASAAFEVSMELLAEYSQQSGDDSAAGELIDALM
jgi:hypothetical protein